ncbi:MAG: AI-2E family transporter [Planctomycetota bacterium]
MTTRQPWTFDRVAHIAVTIGVIYASILLLGYLSSALIPFAIAFLLAYLMQPLVARLEKKIKNHTAAVFLSLGLLTIALTLFALFLIPIIHNEINQAGVLLSQFIRERSATATGASSIPDQLRTTLEAIASREDIRNLLTGDQATRALTEHILPGAWGIVAGAFAFVGWLFGLSVIALYLVFLLLDYKGVIERWKTLLPPTHRESAVALITNIDKNMNRYFRAQASMASIVGILFALGFSIIDLPLGVVFGLFVGALNMIPYLQLVAIIPAVLLAAMRALESQQSFWTVILFVLIVFTVVQLIQELILTPKIMGDATGLSPAMILLSLSIWGRLLGIFGLLIALPATSILLAYYERYIETLGSKAATSDETPIAPIANSEGNAPPVLPENPPASEEISRA